MQKLWLPGRKEKPTVRKAEGGSTFDDELRDESELHQEFEDEMVRLVEHLQQRPDHTVYVSSAEDRTEMREVFNDWNRRGWLNHNPNIRIEYGVPEHSLRIAP